MLIVGARTQEALEAVSGAQGMDVRQTRRRVRAATVHGPSQAARVLAARHLSSQPPQVRAHRQRSAQNREAAPH